MPGILQEFKYCLNKLWVCRERFYLNMDRYLLKLEINSCITISKYNSLILWIINYIYVNKCLSLRMTKSKKTKKIVFLLFMSYKMSNVAILINIWKEKFRRYLQPMSFLKSPGCHHLLTLSLQEYNNDVVLDYPL